MWLLTVALVFAHLQLTPGLHVSCGLPTEYMMKKKEEVNSICPECSTVLFCGSSTSVRENRYLYTCLHYVHYLSAHPLITHSIRFSVVSIVPKPGAALTYASVQDIGRCAYAGAGCISPTGRTYGWSNLNFNDV